MTINILRPVERAILLATHRAQHGSLLTLRKNLNLSLESFAEAVASLELVASSAWLAIRMPLTASSTAPLIIMGVTPLMPKNSRA